MFKDYGKTEISGILVVNEASMVALNGYKGGIFKIN